MRKRKRKRRRKRRRSRRKRKSGGNVHKMRSLHKTSVERGEMEWNERVMCWGGEMECNERVRRWGGEIERWSGNGAGDYL